MTHSILKDPYVLCNNVFDMLALLSAVTVTSGGRSAYVNYPIKTLGTFLIFLTIPFISTLVLA